MVCNVTVLRWLCDFVMSWQEVQEAVRALMDLMNQAGHQGAINELTAPDNASVATIVNIRSGNDKQVGLSDMHT